MPSHARKPRSVREITRGALRAGRGWRRSRPFWGSLITTAGGAEIAAVRLSLPVHDPRTIIPAGVLIAGGIVACGLLLLFDPVQRSVYATTAILLAISALTTSHLGGYLVGTLLGGAGGATAFAWVPARDPAAAELLAQSGPPGFTLILGEADGRSDRSSLPDRELPAPRVIGTGRIGTGRSRAGSYRAGRYRDRELRRGGYSQPLRCAI